VKDILEDIPLDDKEYRRKLYTHNEIVKVIKKYGLPQDYNADGAYGPERYVEAHVWSDETVDRYRTTHYATFE